MESLNDCVFLVFQGTLTATVVKSSYQPKPPLSYIHVFGVASNPSSVTVNGSPISSYSYNPTTKVIFSSVLVVIRSNGNKITGVPFRCNMLLLERRVTVIRFFIDHLRDYQRRKAPLGPDDKQ